MKPHSNKRKRVKRSSCSVSCKYLGITIALIKLSVIIFFHQEILSILTYLAFRQITIQPQVLSPNSSAIGVGKAIISVRDESSPHRIIIEERSVSESIEVNRKQKSDSKRTGRKTKKSAPDEPLYLRSGVYNFQPKWGFNGEEKYIVAVPNIKIPIKWDRRIVFPRGMLQHIYDENHPTTDRMEDQPSIGSTKPDWIPPYLAEANKVLQEHPIFTASQRQLGKLDELMYYLSSSASCIETPIFLTMATIGDDLYWQLVENFVYTLVKYNLSNCALIVCVSDAKCMRKCGDYSFPCFNYISEKTSSSMSVMEQIAILKLQHIPKALGKGVDVFMLDLDVGFLANPNLLLQVYRETPIVDIFVQEDFIYLMNRTTAGWKTWYTEPLPNIGMFLCRGNNKTAKVFEIALQNYHLLKDVEEKSKPGIDQKKVLNAIQVGRGTFALKFAYFTTSTAPLLDKFIKERGNVYEVGGEFMLQALHRQSSMAMHTTCYEKSTKVMGLKASSAFWNPRYYDPLRRTITKQLLFTTEKQLRSEIRSLIWLAMLTDRSVIIPNLLGDDRVIHTIDQVYNRTMWPGFRVANIAKQVKVSVLEPAYYWRVTRDYSSKDCSTPAAKILYFAKGESIERINEKLSSLSDYYRIILHPKPPRNRLRAVKVSAEHSLEQWADHSVGDFGSADDETFASLLSQYRPLPDLESAMDQLEGKEKEVAQEVVENVRPCYGVFGPPRGNSTCFQICE